MPSTSNNANNFSYLNITTPKNGENVRAANISGHNKPKSLKVPKNRRKWGFAFIAGTGYNIGTTNFNSRPREGGDTGWKSGRNFLNLDNKPTDLLPRFPAIGYHARAWEWKRRTGSNRNNGYERSVPASRGRDLSRAGKMGRLSAQ